MIRKSITLLTLVSAISHVELASAQENASSNRWLKNAPSLDRWSFAVGLGTTDIQGVTDNVFDFGILAAYNYSPMFALGFTVDYWNDSSGDYKNNQVEFEDLIAGIHGKFYASELPYNIRPFALAGLSMHRFQVDVARLTNLGADADLRLREFDRSTQNIENEAGADFALGLAGRIQNATDLIAEIRYRRLFDQTIDLDQTNYSIALAYTL